MLKQKVYILMFFIFFISLPSYPQYPITNGSLSKNCEDLLEENIVNYKLCEGWLLDKDAVTDIIQHKEVAHILNPVRDLSPFDMLIYYSIDVIENNISYHLTVYATSWLSLYNKEMKSIKYYYCNSEKCTGYFIGNPINERLLSESNRAYSWGDEEEALKRITDNKNKVIGFLENNTLDIKWFGTYTFPDYELMIDENGYELKNLTDSSTVDCYALEKNVLYIFSALKTDKRYTDFIYMNKSRFNDGDFIFKISYAK